MLSILIFVVIAGAVHSEDENLVLEQQQHTFQILVRNMRVIKLMVGNGTNPDVSNSIEACFSYTQRKQIENLASFQTEMQDCGKAAADGNAVLWRQGNETRSILVKQADLGCNNLRSCESLSDSFDFFACYGRIAFTISEDLQKMSLSSNEQLQSMSTEYKQIDFEQNKCKINARNTYVAASAATDREMQYCIMGDFVTPTVPSSGSTTTSQPTASTPSDLFLTT